MFMNQFRKLVFTLIGVSLISSTGFGQVAVNTDNSAPDALTMLDVKSVTSGLTTRVLGQGLGTETSTILSNQLPAHPHSIIFQ